MARSTTVIALSQREAEAYQPNPGEVCISIRCHGSTVAELQSGWESVLWVECDDDSFRDWRTRDRMLTPESALRLIRWVDQHRAAPLIVAHCVAGVSRSVTVMLAIRVMLGKPIGRGKTIPNPGLFGLLMEAWGWHTRTRQDPAGRFEYPTPSHRRAAAGAEPGEPG